MKSRGRVRYVAHALPEDDVKSLGKDRLFEKFTHLQENVKFYRGEIPSKPDGIGYQFLKTY